MKALVLLLVSLPLWACPEIDGRFNTCYSDNNRELPENMSIDVTMLGDQSYRVVLDSDEMTQTQEVIADGVERETVVTNSTMGRLKLKITATCPRNILQIVTRTRVLGIKIEETTRFSIQNNALHMNRIKQGRVVESVVCR